MKIVRPRHFVAFVAAASVWAAAAVAGISHLAQAATIPADLARSSSGILGEATMASAQGEELQAGDVGTTGPTIKRGWQGVTLGRDPGFVSCSLTALGALKYQDGRCESEPHRGGSLQGIRPVLGAGESLMLRPSPGLPELAAAASHLCGVDADVYAELIGRESSWRQTDAQGRTLRSRAGALGMSQIKASTAAEISPTLRPDVAADNAIAGACHLRRLVDRFGGSYRVALAAYVIGANSPHLHTSPKARAYAEGILAAAEARR